MDLGTKRGLNGIGSRYVYAEKDAHESIHCINAKQTMVREVMNSASVPGSRLKIVCGWGGST